MKSLRLLRLDPLLLALVLSSAAFASACGDDDPTDTSSGTSTGGSGGAPTTATTGGSAGDGGSGAGGECTIEGFTVGSERAVLATDFSDFAYYGSVMNTEPTDTLLLEIHANEGGTLGAHSFNFTGENWDSCSTCLIIESQCPMAVCERVFLIRSGTLNVTEAESTDGGGFKATLSNLVLDEVTRNDTGSFRHTTLVPGGDVWCIDDLVELDTTVTLIDP